MAISKVERLVIIGLELKAATIGLTPAEIKAHRERVLWMERS